MSANIKKNGKPDLGLIYSEVPANVAGMFTQNQVKAAPVVLTKARVAGGVARAIIANAGNANCCTGAQGMAHAREMGRLIAQGLEFSEDQVLVASTGVIGAPLPIDMVRSAVPELIDKMHPQGFELFSRAIMTTDTVPKLVCRQAVVENRPFTILVAAKGAGMIRPDMATMLCFICTDAAVPVGMLQTMLRNAVDRSLNRLTIDGDTSTNDTVLIMANGQSGVEIKSDEQQALFQSLLDELLIDISRKLVKDGEGVTKMVDILVKGASSNDQASQIAEVVAHSPLVKTAFFGEDANWGRIVGAVGRAGVPFEPERVDIYFDDVQMVKSGLGCGQEQEDRVTAVMKQSEFTVVIDLNMGQGQASMLTCDFSIDYVKINADYRS